MLATSLRLEVGPLPQNARFALRAIFDNKVINITSELWNIFLRGRFGTIRYANLYFELYGPFWKRFAK